MKRRDEVLVGIFTTAAIAVIIVGALWLARGGLTSGYPLYSRFPWGSGLKQGQPVWLAGVTAGFVDDVSLDPKGTVVVTYRLRDEYKVPRGTTATVVPNGFFGDMADLFGDEKPETQEYRIKLEEKNGVTSIFVLDTEGKPQRAGLGLDLLKRLNETLQNTSLGGKGEPPKP